MLKFKKSLLLAASVVLASGCVTAPTSPLKFNDKKSRALNIAEAGGIYKGVKDSKIPKDSTGALTDSAIYNSMYAGLGFVNPGPGLTNLQGLGVGMLAGMFEPDSPGARNSLMAWMPVGMAKDEVSAQRLMSDIVVKATVDALEHLKYPATNDHKNSKEGEAVYIHISKSYAGCETSSCFIKIYTPLPGKYNSPEYVADGDLSYEFQANASHKYFQASTEFPKNANFNTLEIYKEISNRLPNWAFLYVSPAKTYQEGGKKIKTPILFEKGTPNFFMVRE